MSEAPLIPARELAAKNTWKNPGESPGYREARQQLLAEEIALRRQIERVAQMRRALPLGGEVPENYLFQGEKGPVSLRDLFGDKKTLFIYNYMFGPLREAPCPMCTSWMRVWAEKMPAVQERLALVFVARSPIEKILADKPKRGLAKLPTYSDPSGAYTRAYVTPEDGDWAGMNVFKLENGRIHHFWRNEFSFEMADPGQDPRTPVDLDSLWNLLDYTPEGRGDKWYPKL